MCARVLTVDDSKFLRNTLQEIFANNGYEIAGEAENGEEAIETYKKLKPDLVTMDIIMPKISGIDAVKAIISYDPDAKIIMCSALDHQELIEDAIKAGAKGYIIKPFSPEEVLDTANKVLSK